MMKTETHSNKYSKFIIKMLLPSCLMAAAVFLAYFFWSRGAFLPKWIKWVEKDTADVSGVYNVSLCDKTVSVAKGGTEIWTLPDNVKAQDMLVADIDNDGDDELLILCWKVGRYGDARPFWVSDADAENDKWSQHLFVYEFKGDKVKAKWMSSYLGIDAVDIKADESSKGAIILFTERNGNTSAWRWDSWGFTRLGEF